ncbi:MAG: hypothetical protein JSV33_12545 [bacterium]|nr:MAG: hypothetical protein JSV33_12545 [bacterium]
MKRQLTLLMVLATLLIYACIDESSFLRPGGGLSNEEREELVRAQCQIVAAAVEAFAGGNDDNYPEDVSIDTTEAGQTLVDLLPDGTLLPNAFTGQDTEPVDHRAESPGEIGYEPLYRGCGINPGYTITGYGADSIIVEISNIPALEDSVRANCLRVQAAADAFAAQNNDIYPQDVDVDMTPAGDTVIDLLPGGSYLVNPFTGMVTEPVNHQASYPGQTGYVPIIGTHPVHGPGVCVGYTITGVGRVPDALIVIIEYRLDEE